MAMQGGPKHKPEGAPEGAETLRASEKLKSREAQKQVMALLKKAEQAEHPEEAYHNIKLYIEAHEAIQKLHLEPEVEQRALVAYTRPMAADLILDKQEIRNIQRYVKARLDLLAATVGHKSPSIDRQSTPTSTPGGGAPRKTPKMPEGTNIELPGKIKKMSVENQLMNIPRLSKGQEIVAALDDIAEIRAQFTNGEIRPDLVFEHSRALGGTLDSNKMAKAVFGVNEDTLQLILDSNFSSTGTDPKKFTANNVDGFKDKRAKAFIDRLYKREARADSNLGKGKTSKGQERRIDKEEKTDTIINLLKNKDTIKQYIVAFNKLKAAMEGAALHVDTAKTAKEKRLTKLRRLDTAVIEEEDRPEVKKHALLTQYFDPKNAGDIIKMGLVERLRHLDQWGHARPTTTSLTIGRETKKVSRFRGMDRKYRMNEPIRSKTDYAAYKEMMSLSETEIQAQLEKWRELGQEVRQLRAGSPRVKDNFDLGKEASKPVTGNPDDLTIYDVRLGQHFEQELKAETQRVEAMTVGAARAQLNEALKPGTPIIDQMVEKVAEDENLSIEQKMRLKDDLNNRLTVIFNTMVGWKDLSAEEKESFWSAYLATPYEISSIPGLKLHMGLGTDDVLTPQLYFQGGATYSLNFGEAGRHEVTVGAMTQLPRNQSFNPTAPFKPFATLDYKLHAKKVALYATAGANAGLIDWGVHAGVGYDRQRSIQHQWRRFMDENGRGLDGGEGAAGWDKLEKAADSSELAQTPAEKIALKRILLEEMKKDFFVDHVTGFNALAIGVEAGVSFGSLWANAVPNGAKKMTGGGAFVGVNFSNVQREGTRQVESDLRTGVDTEYDHSVIIEDGEVTARINPHLSEGAAGVLKELTDEYKGFMALGQDERNPSRNTIQFMDGNGQPLEGPVTIMMDKDANIPLAVPESDNPVQSAFVTNLNSTELPHVHITRIVDQFTGEQLTHVYVSNRELSPKDIDDTSRFQEGLTYTGGRNGKIMGAERVGTAPTSDQRVYLDETAYSGAPGDLTQKGAKDLDKNLESALLSFKDRNLEGHEKALTQKEDLANAAEAKIFAGQTLSNKDKRTLLVASTTLEAADDQVKPKIEQVLSDAGLKINDTNIQIVRQVMLERLRPTSKTAEAWSKKAMGLLIGEEFAKHYYHGEGINVGDTLKGDQWRHLDNVTGFSNLKDGVIRPEKLIISDKGASQALNGGRVLNAVTLVPSEIEDTLDQLNIPAEEREAVKDAIQEELKAMYDKKVLEMKDVQTEVYKDAYETEISRMILETYQASRSGSGGDRAKIKQLFLRNGIDLDQVLTMQASPKSDDSEQMELAEKYREMIEKLYTEDKWNGIEVKHKVWAGTVESCYNPGVVHDMELSLPELESSVTMARVVSSVDTKAGLKASAFKSAIPTQVADFKQFSTDGQSKQTGGTRAPGSIDDGPSGY